jgi:cytoskeletal protein RodZ
MRVDTGRLRVVPPDTALAAHLDDLDDLGELPELEDDGISSPGAYIRKHRLRRGLSVEQLAVATKIPRSSLELLEDDRYGDLPGPVFVKGFLRCAARALSLSPDAVMELLYERERAALQARRQSRPVTGALPVPAGTSKAKAPSRVRAKTPPPSPGAVWVRLRAILPGPHVLLWILVAMFVAFLVLGAFNLVGGTAAPPPS